MDPIASARPLRSPSHDGGEIAVEMRQLHDQLERLADSWQTHANRIDPILAPTPGEKGSGRDTLAGPATKLVNAIRIAREKVNAIANDIGDVTSRVEL